MTTPVPREYPDPNGWLRRIAAVVNQILDGKHNATGAVTLSANQTTTTVTDPRVGSASVIHFMPTTANAAAEMDSMYVMVRGDGSFTITHSNAATTNRTFAYSVHGSVGTPGGIGSLTFDTQVGSIILSGVVADAVFSSPNFIPGPGGVVITGATADVVFS